MRYFSYLLNTYYKKQKVSINENVERKRSMYIVGRNIKW